MGAPDPRLVLLDGCARALAEAVDYDAGERLMIHFGGQRRFVPRAMRPSSPFWEALGRETALQLSALFGGDYIVVPVGRKLSDAKRHEAMARYDGSKNEAARHFGVTARTIQTQRAKLRAPLPLFDGPSKRP